ncbi:MAG: TIGR00730 family Rossman fold protein [Leptothrix sp. (in: b-proteobacteria)]
MSAPTHGHSRIGGLIHQELRNAKRLLDLLPPAVAIFGGSRIRPEDHYYGQAVELARSVSQVGIPVISGGGPGIMEAANKGARQGVHGLSIGLKITLPFEETPNPHQDICVEFHSFAARKVTFCKYSGAVVAMPGGLGTLDELFEVLTLVQTGKMPSIPVLLYGAEFWSGLVAWLRTTVLARGLVSAADIARRIQIVDSVEAAMAIIGVACLAAPRGTGGRATLVLPA